MKGSIFSDTQIAPEPADHADQADPKLFMIAPACNGPCDQGRSECPTPSACLRAAVDDGRDPWESSDGLDAARGVIWALAVTIGALLCISLIAGDW